MKIDITQIPNFDTLPDEAKNAILAMEFADAPDMSQFVAKSAFDKKASEAADLGRQLKARMTEEEAKAAKDAEERAALIARVEELEKEKAVTSYVNSYLALGYEEKLAKSSAEAIVKGDMDTVFANQKSFAAAQEKLLRAELLKQTPPPPAGGTPTGMKKEEFMKLSLAEKQKFFVENPETYKEIYGGN